MSAAKKPKLTVFEKSLLKTLEVREEVPADLRPLFDHCINLARDSHKHGWYTRAGQELLHARRLTRYAKKG